MVSPSSSVYSIACDESEGVGFSLLAFVAGGVYSSLAAYQFWCDLRFDVVQSVSICLRDPGERDGGLQGFDLSGVEALGWSSQLYLKNLLSRWKGSGVCPNPSVYVCEVEGGGGDVVVVMSEWVVRVSGKFMGWWVSDDVGARLREGRVQVGPLFGGIAAPEDHRAV